MPRPGGCWPAWCGSCRRTSCGRSWGGYGLAAVAPGPGAWLVDASVGGISVGAAHFRLRVPVLLLAGVLAAAGLAANRLVPLVFIGGVALGLRPGTSAACGRRNGGSATTTGCSRL